jgi:hypothetical protein
MVPRKTSPRGLLRSIPVGIESLLAMAAAHKPFATELLAHRDGVAEASGYDLTDNERRLLATVPEPQLREILAAMRERQPESERRHFLLQASAAITLLLAGTCTAGCEESRKPRQSRNPPKTPQRPERPMGLMRPGVRRVANRPDDEHRFSMGCRVDSYYSYRRVAVSLVELRVTGGQKSAAVRKTVETAKLQWQLCFRGTAMLRQNGDHSVALGFTINKHGNVEKLVQTQSVLKHTTIEDCLRRVMLGLRFNRSRKETRVSLRLGFSIGIPPANKHVRENLKGLFQ